MQNASLRLPVLLATRPIPPLLLRHTCALILSQRRGLAKQQFGGFTRDPFKTFQKKLARAQQRKHAKQPLESDERSQQNLQLPVNVQSLGQLVVSCAPLESFARAPLYTRMGWVQRLTSFKESLATIYAGAVIRRKLRKVEPFQPISFAQRAQEMFVEVNGAIQRRDKWALRNLTTENASESLKAEFEGKRFEWKIEQTLQRPRVVGARIAPFLTKENLFAQVVVRLHTAQVLAVYNTAGALLHGHASQAKKVIDYVVFERHLMKAESRWRIAGKLPPQQPWRKVGSSQSPLQSASVS